MKKPLSILFAFILMVTPFLCFGAAENWKGEAPKHEITLSALGGLGILDGTAAATMMGSLAKKIVSHGFADDLNNQVYVEALLGPVFLPGTANVTFGAHLRWDFGYTEDWAFYGLGGVGFVKTSDILGNRLEVFPRFGVGTFWHFSRTVSLRAELSHDFSGVGFTAWF